MSSDASPLKVEERSIPGISETGSKESQETTETPVSSSHGIRFWLVFIALCFCVLLSALDLGGVGTAAPTIVADLHGSDFSWVGSAYTLSSAAFLPLSGNLAQIFGRRLVTLGAVSIFAIGSAVSGSARSMTVLIVGRAIQGVGGGGTQALVYIITADLIPLRERGLFNGITGMIWTVGSITGPFIAGALAQKATWRWLFYLNLPLCALAFASVALFLDVVTPEGGILEKLAAVDWIGNILLIASSTSCMLGLTWGGGRFSWSSPQVLAPLIIGLCGLALSVLYELTIAIRPTIPKSVISNRGSLLGYVATFLHGVVAISVTFYMPTWFQAVRDATPIQSGLYFLPMAAAISPAAILEGIIISKIGHYRLVNFTGWATLILGLGLFISLHRTTALGPIIVYQLIQGIGMGLLYATTFVVLAPLPVSENASAISLLTFVRTFAQSWGIAIAGSIIQNKLSKSLPTSITEQFSPASLVYGVIPEIARMPEPLKSQVQNAFVDSMRLSWIVLAALCGVGFLTVFFIKDIPLNRQVDKKWGLVQKEAKADAELNEKQTPAAVHVEDSIRRNSEVVGSPKPVVVGLQTRLSTG
ncbi:MFS general substrate transporter [Mycena metata]|uniref:MFS general substrate transporter n=1 Tax=Mycena metata TaxID=1033252 RepID=A0AAD7I9J8_9AGAR|nr:MFS general substrate transporter [Mycena metata]